MTEYDTPPEFDEGWYYSRSPKYWFDSGYNQGRRAGYHDAKTDSFQHPRQHHELGFNEGYERGHKDGVSYAMSHINNHTRELSDRIGKLESENEELRNHHKETDVEEKRKSFTDGFQEGKRRVQDQKQASFNEGYLEAKAYWQQLRDETREYWKAKERDARENAQESIQQQMQQLNEDKTALYLDREKAWSEVFRERNKREEDRNWFWNKINELETELDQNRQDKN